MQLSNKVEFPEDRSTLLPLVGRIAAGYPIEAIEDQETLDIESLFTTPGRGKNTFVLQVTGDSMIDDHICDGDYVICQKRNTARNGETVVALLENGDATLKKLYRENGQIRLQPANDKYDPIIVDQCEIQGVLIGLIRCP